MDRLGELLGLTKLASCPTFHPLVTCYDIAKSWNQSRPFVLMSQLWWILTQTFPREPDRALKYTKFVVFLSFSRSYLALSSPAALSPKMLSLGNDDHLSSAIAAGGSTASIFCKPLPLTQCSLLSPFLLASLPPSLQFLMEAIVQCSWVCFMHVKCCSIESLFLLSHTSSNLFWSRLADQRGECEKEVVLCAHREPPAVLLQVWGHKTAYGRLHHP